MQQYTVPAGTVYPNILAPLRQRIFTYSQFAVCCAEGRLTCLYGATRYGRDVGAAAVDVADDGRPAGLDDAGHLHGLTASTAAPAPRGGRSRCRRRTGPARCRPPGAAGSSRVTVIVTSTVSSSSSRYPPSSALTSRAAQPVGGNHGDRNSGGQDQRGQSDGDPAGGCGPSAAGAHSALRDARSCRFWMPVRSGSRSTELEL